MNDSRKIKDGGPAFPFRPGDWAVDNTGMSLRDFFAAFASKDDLMAYRGDSGTWAEAKFRYANAMIMHREKGIENDTD